MNDKYVKSVAKFTIGKVEELKRCEIFYNITDNKLIFVGSGAQKTTSGKIWHEYVRKEQNLTDIGNEAGSNFKDVVETIYNEMKEKEETLKTLQELFKEIDAIEIASTTDDQPSDQ